MEKYSKEQLAGSLLYYLVEQGLNPNTQDGLALIDAIEQGHLQAVEYLLEQGANPNTPYGGALIEAAYQGRLTIVQCLVEHGANVGVQGSTPLITAIKRGHVEVVQYLVEKEAYKYINENTLSSLRGFVAKMSSKSNDIN